MTTDLPPCRPISWPKTHRIIRSRFPPIDLFEDIADPEDWPLILAAETKTNPRLATTIGNLDLVPPERRIGGAGASWTMAPFTHISTDRKSRFSDGTFGVYYAGDSFEVAVFETIHHHNRFMAATAQEPGWTSDFRELIGKLNAELHDIRNNAGFKLCLDPDDYAPSQNLARLLRNQHSNGLIYPSVRFPEGDCLAAFWPDIAGLAIQGRHLSYHWDGAQVDLIKDITNGEVMRVRV